MKWRFLDGGPNEEGLMAGTFSIVVVPTGNENRGLGGGEVKAFLPV